MGGKVLSESSLTALAQRIPEWESLAQAASEDNPFYEPWMLLPALESLGESQGVEVVFIYLDESLCGVFPLQRATRYRRIPWLHYRLWQHRHCYLGTPLLRKGSEEAVLREFFGWLRARRGGKLLSLPWLGADGPVYRALRAQAVARHWGLSEESYERAVLRELGGGEAYLQETISGKHRRDYARIEKRLSESGEFTTARVESEEGLDHWLSAFFALEESGWKGKAGTALGASAGDRAFMTRIVSEAFKRGRALLFISSLDGKPFAVKCEFACPSTCFAFKIAFNEEHRKSRPGLLLELWRLRQIRSVDFALLDSCSQPGSMFDRLWKDRRRIANLTIATRAFPDAFIMRSIPVAKNWARRLRGAKDARPNPANQAKESPGAPDDSKADA